MPGRRRQAGCWNGQVMRWAEPSRLHWQIISCCLCRWMRPATPLAELLRAAKPGAVALGGRLSVQAKTIAQEAGVELVDYFARPELTVYNAIPTAEGCIGILLAERTRTLWGTNLLLLGFGPVGQALGARLAALGGKCDCLCPARRTACAGREPWSAGCRACPAGRAGSGL